MSSKWQIECFDFFFGLLEQCVKPNRHTVASYRRRLGRAQGAADYHTVSNDHGRG